MDKPIEKVLSNVPPDRRRFVQTILGLAGYAVPTVRSFIMASAVVPMVSAAVTTTATPTTTRNAWRPVRPNQATLLREQPSGVSDPLIKHPTEGAGTVMRRPSEGSGPLIPRGNRPGPKKP